MDVQARPSSSVSNAFKEMTDFELMTTAAFRSVCFAEHVPVPVMVGAWQQKSVPCPWSVCEPDFKGNVEINCRHPEACSVRGAKQNKSLVRKQGGQSTYASSNPLFLLLLSIILAGRRDLDSSLLSHACTKRTLFLTHVKILSWTRQLQF